jgi:hypothetical protein
MSDPAADADPRAQYRPTNRSNAIDAISIADCTAASSGPNPLFNNGENLAADGRSQYRPTDGDKNGDARCDAGAIEFQPRLTITLIAGTPVNTPFTFRGELGAFTLSDPGDSQRPFEQPDGHSYFVQEQVPPGWVIESIVCSGDADAGSAVDLATAAVQIDLDAYEYINCTFINREAPVPTGSITIINDARPANNNPFSYTGDLGDFKLTGPNHASISFHDVIIGIYEVAEVVPPGWIVQAITCQGDTDGRSSVNIANAALIVDLDADEVVTCTFVNEETEPPPVIITDLAAAADGVAVNIHWETTAEVDLVGFQVQRSASAAGPFAPINSMLISPKGEGSQYTYTDTTDLGTYYYSIVSLLENQDTTKYGPVRVEVLGFPAYLPVLR